MRKGIIKERTMREGAFAVQCTSCGLIKVLSDFYRQFHQPNPNDPRARCKACESVYYKTKNNTEEEILKRKKWALQYKYSISPEEYDALLQEYDFQCAICKKGPPEVVLCVDHCKITGQIRGVLCVNHNLGIGDAKHDIKLLQNLIDYLIRFRRSYEDDQPTSEREGSALSQG